LIYLLDTNVISHWLERRSVITARLEANVQQGHALAISQPVYFELQRGLIWGKKVRKQRILRDYILPLLDWVSMTDEDWRQAAQFWADATSLGRQLNDVGVLLVAIAHRLDAIIVSSDADFDALPVKREDWR
jgi:predicted nucleic acid-binding protein